MTHATEFESRSGSQPGILRHLLARLVGRHGVLPAQPAPHLGVTAGPDPAALVDADMARLASFANWTDLRDDLRSRARARPHQV